MVGTTDVQLGGERPRADGFPVALKQWSLFSLAWVEGREAAIPEHPSPAGGAASSGLQGTEPRTRPVNSRAWTPVWTEGGVCPGARVAGAGGVPRPSCLRGQEAGTSSARPLETSLSSPCAVDPALKHEARPLETGLLVGRTARCWGLLPLCGRLRFTSEGPPQTSKGKGSRTRESCFTLTNGDRRGVSSSRWRCRTRQGFHGRGSCRGSWAPD